MSGVHKWLLSALLTVGVASATAAQPPYPYPPSPYPPQRPKPSSVEGIWYYRGDPQRVCYIETVSGPRGTRLLFTNEKGSEASGQISSNGRLVTIPGWKENGTVRGDRIVWANGDFWQRR